MAPASVSKEFLDSDRLNFLVWRYLLEGNYRETAAKFQKEWHIPEPHRHFEFAPYVKSHALVSVINKGLVYYSLERTATAPPQVNDAAATTDVKGVFGPLITEPPPPPKVEEPESKVVGVSGDGEEGSRKRQVDKQLQNGSPAKKAKLSNGFGAAGSGDANSATPMDIDSTENQQNQHAYPSPMERDTATEPVPRTNGPDKGTQMDKVEELAPETMYLRLTPDHAGQDENAVAAQNPAHENPIVLHCEWNPSNPSVLAASGTDALARIWTVSRATGPDPVNDHVNGTNRAFKDLMEEDAPQTATVTAMAWNHDGSAIALATEAENKARISIWAADGTALFGYNVQEPPIIKLRWNPASSSLLGISPSNGGTLVTVFSAVTSNTVTHFLPDHDLVADPIDAAWINETDFLLCGGSLLVSLRINETGIASSKKFNTTKNDSFDHIQYDSLTKIAATAGDKGVIDLWDESGERRSISAHIGPVTCLMWQPLQSAPASDERLLASGGEDGAIIISNARLPESKPKWSMTMDLPVVALSFTPDGAFIAGATPDRILIWKVGDHAVPRASWRRTPHPGWLSPKSPKTNGEQEEEDTHCLCWDSTGQKLAYGVNNRLAVINFR